MREDDHGRIWWECTICGAKNRDTDRCDCGYWSPWFKSRNEPDGDPDLDAPAKKLIAKVKERLGFDDDNWPL